MESGYVFNLQDFEQNEVPFKQRSFEDSIYTFFSLFDADLLSNMKIVNLVIWAKIFKLSECPIGRGKV